MNEEILEYYREAGMIASKVLTRAAGMVRTGEPVLELVETIEAAVSDEGGALAFPLNISSNENAAHDTAGPGDERLFSAGDLIKVDLGVHIEGYIADTAVTVDLGENGPLVEASAAALERAIELIRPGVPAGDLGAAIQEEIEGRGFRPVANLTGHGLGHFSLHGSPTIPNIAVQGGTVLKEGMAFAIEPFATTGSGRVSESQRIEIFSQLAVKPVRLPAAKKLLEAVRPRSGLPFSRRWIPGTKVDLAIATLRRAQILHAYPVLHDIPGSLVSQAEHTVIVTEDGCLVTTRR
ncbi:MAG: type II methionyl aminopeptidase [Methanomicrobiaceae archaeon]|nr:type II methionyl aminopeptidase [Methanomicrobiaceae archaeon]